MCKDGLADFFAMGAIDKSTQICCEEGYISQYKFPGMVRTPFLLYRLISGVGHPSRDPLPSVSENGAAEKQPIERYKYNVVG